MNLLTAIILGLAIGIAAVAVAGWLFDWAAKQIDAEEMEP